MSAAVKVRKTLFKSWLVDAAEGCACLVDPEAYIFPDVLLFPGGFAQALDFAVTHAATHTCPSWRASGERCTTFCACGGRGWVA